MRDMISWIVNIYSTLEKQETDLSWLLTSMRIPKKKKNKNKKKEKKKKGKILLALKNIRRTFIWIDGRTSIFDVNCIYTCLVLIWKEKHLL